MPVNAADLQQFLCATNWMRQSIPSYEEVSGVLYDCLNRAEKKCRSAKKSKLARVVLSEVDWGTEQEQALKALKESLVNMVPLGHADQNQEFCLFTDASSNYWGAALTQVPRDDMKLALDIQRHTPLAFLSGQFRGAAQRWAIVEKEAFAVVESCKRLEYLLIREQGFHIYTDHRNLQYIYDPVKVVGDIAKYRADKLQRWGIYLMGFKYDIEHVLGEANVWGDLLSRWGATQEDHETKHQVRTIAVVEKISPLREAAFDWPTEEEILDAQKESWIMGDEIPDGVVLNDERGVYEHGGRIWIPNSNGDYRPGCASSPMLGSMDIAVSWPHLEP